MNKNIAILDPLFGDSGKGKITHYFSSSYDWVVKFNGGNNAGHTIYSNGKKYVHHLVPSIDFSNSAAKGFLGAGMVIDPEALLSELSELEKDFSGISSRIFIDPDAFVVLPKHKETDKADNKHLGTTNKGIGPAYADRVSRSGTKIIQLINDNSLITSALQKLGVQFKYSMELKQELLSSKVLFEGSQGTLLCINNGIYPYVSSSDCTVAGIAASGFGFIMPSKVYGVSKAYTTKVGAGPFPTELDGDVAESLRKSGQEFGATTGRPRRIGWIDLPAIKYSVQKSGITDLIITKLDILNGWKKVPICHKYDKDPVSGNCFFKAKPQYTDVSGWEDAKDTNQIKDFINSIEKYTETKVSMISFGVNKSDILSI